MSLLFGSARRYMLVVTAGCVLALGGAKLAAATSGHAAAAKPLGVVRQPICAHLRVDRVAEVDVGDLRQDRSWEFAFTNVGSTTCRLQGYPEVGLLDVRARDIPGFIGHIFRPQDNVVLETWHRAFFSVRFAATGCRPAIFVYGLRIGTPHSPHVSIWSGGRFHFCPRSPIMSVTPIMATAPLGRITAPR